MKPSIIRFLTFLFIIIIVMMLIDFATSKRLFFATKIDIPKFRTIMLSNKKEKEKYDSEKNYIEKYVLDDEVFSNMRIVYGGKEYNALYKKETVLKYVKENYNSQTTQTTNSVLIEFGKYNTYDGRIYLPLTNELLNIINSIKE